MEKSVPTTYTQVTATTPKPNTTPHLTTEVLYEWRSTNKLISDLTMKEFKTLSSIFILVAIYMIIIANYVVAALLISILFLVYAIVTAPAQYIQNSIRETGIFTDQQLFPWENIVGFWFTHKSGSYMLNLETTLQHPRRIIILLPSSSAMLELYELILRIRPYKILTKGQSWYQRTVDGDHIDVFKWIAENRPDLLKKN